MLPRYLMNFNSSELETHSVDFIVIGSGLAGMYTSLHLAATGEVALVTKKELMSGSTLYAQGGIASAIKEPDSPDLHFEDTVKAGAGICNEEAVRVLTKEGPQRIQELLDMKFPFDQANGSLALGREGAHTFPRVLHAGGDATGKIFSSYFAEHLKQQEQIMIFENSMAVDLLLDKHGRCVGIIAMDIRSKRLFIIYAKVTILAAGGIGQVYKYTTNPLEATGDGVAMAARAGARIINMEFIQFHPTALNHPDAKGFLVSEAVRGEGGILKNSLGEAFMSSYHPQADLAPRDIVARAIEEQLQETGEVFLDVTHLGHKFFSKRFPSIYSMCKKIGLDPSKKWIPVAPAAHYLMGGIEVDINGATSIDGLYACGEAACTGVHGANRLASNSLLEALVFGKRTAMAAAAEFEKPVFKPEGHKIISKNQRKSQVGSYAQKDKRLKEIMQNYAGIVRSNSCLNKGLKELEELLHVLHMQFEEVEWIELQNKIIVGYLIIKTALEREESCGAHHLGNIYCTLESNRVFIKKAEEGQL